MLRDELKVAMALAGLKILTCSVLLSLNWNLLANIV